MEAGEQVANTVDVAEWVDTITAQARNTHRRSVFSASVPVSAPTTAATSNEGLLSSVIESVEREGWRLDNVSPYGAQGALYDPYPTAWALLIFRAAHERHV